MWRCVSNDGGGALSTGGDIEDISGALSTGGDIEDISGALSTGGDIEDINRPRRGQTASPRRPFVG
ncbi:MAG: hypothetical protein IKU11_12495, partial [Clostridia bacterium]|nr:hypothetical protein [Clostridia bacterium]